MDVENNVFMFVLVAGLRRVTFNSLRTSCEPCTPDYSGVFLKKP
nr:MAG TPA: hypothetical protein [Caudoviricetes sp.]